MPPRSGDATILRHHQSRINGDFKDPTLVNFVELLTAVCQPNGRPSQPVPQPFPRFPNHYKHPKKAGSDDPALNILHSEGFGDSADSAEWPMAANIN